MASVLLRQVQRKLFEHIERDNLKRLLVGRSQVKSGGFARVVSLMPAHRTETPSITRFQPGEAISVSYTHLTLPTNPRV